MKILQIETSCGFGGQEEWVLRLSVALMRRGHTVWIACRPDTMVAQKADELGIPQWSLQKIRNSLDTRAITGLLRIIRQEKIEVTHTHDARATWVAYFASHLSSLFPPRFNRPVLMRTRHLVYNSRYAFPYKYLSDGVVTVSKYLRDYLIEEKGIVSSKIHVIPPGVDVNLFCSNSAESNVRQELKIPQEVSVIGMVGFLRKEKGHRILIEAARRILFFYPETRFLLVGSGEEEEGLRELIRQWGIENNFIFTGYQTDIPRLLVAMDIFVLPSLREAISISLMEAMAMERPAIASRVGGIPEVLKDRETGILVPPNEFWVE